MITWDEHELNYASQVYWALLLLVPSVLNYHMYKDPLFHLLFQALPISQHFPNMAHLEDTSGDV
jgi:hypothetical protein